MLENSSGKGASYQVWMSKGPKRIVRMRSTEGSFLEYGPGVDGVGDAARGVARSDCCCC